MTATKLMKKILIVFFVVFTKPLFAQINCNHWLKTPSVPSSVRIGQLNIKGNKLTIEALINRTQPYSGGQVWAGDIVSKHIDVNDVNYLLRPNSGEITTSNGYYKTPDITDVELNKTHHVAMVYDGSILKFYRDGCLMSEIPASGNLVQNSWEASIGYFSPQVDGKENFIGYINEVRIWNVVRTQDELRTYMNTSLPNPTTQIGLLAYYTFDNLNNKQGNPQWNGTLNGSASINQMNPACATIVIPCICNLSITKTADATICANSQLQLLVSGGTHYSWTPAIGLNNSDIANPVATPATTTKYYVTVSNDDGCSKEDSVNITVNPLPVISKSNDTSICSNTKAFLIAKGGSSYSWTPANSLDNANIFNPIALPLANTTYTVKVTDNNGCSQTGQVNVNIYPVATVEASNDTSICKNTSVKLFASGGVSYSWAPASSLNNSTSPSPIATPSQTTLYFVNVKDQYSCVYKDSIKLSILPDAVFSVSPDHSVCENDAVQLSASGGDTYVWTPVSFLDNPNVNNPVATADSSIVYSVTIKENTCNQSAILTTRINVLPKPSVHASKSNEIDCFSSSAQLNASGANQYVWSPSSELNNPESANPTATPGTTTVYTVTGKDMNGCTNSDTVTVKVNFDRSIFFRLPNSFTPNGDGLNDCFGVSNWGTVAHLELSIYNRFGQRIFYTNNPAVCWDGTFHGKQQNADVYVYTIKATMSCGKIDKKGTVTLLR